MKPRLFLSAVLFSCMIGSVTANKISLQLSNITMKDAIEKIKEKTGVSFFFNVNDVDLNRKISIKASNGTLAEVLPQLLAGQKLTYEVKNNHVVISKIQDVKQEADLLTVKGLVTDLKGEPLVGVNIAVDGKGATITDIDGNYSVKAPSNGVITYTYVGYEAKNVKINNRTNLSVKLQESSLALNEVVVVGYGVQKKANLTGAVDMVSSDAFENLPQANLGASLQGAIPSLNISMPSGKPGQKSEMDIRGYGSINGSKALVLIDGIEGDMDRLNPRDVESVSVLKDASSAAIYGSRAAFGVILITTKKGDAGNAKISYNGRYGFGKFTTRNDFVTTGYDAVSINNLFSQTFDGTNRISYDEQDMEELYARRNDVKEHPDRPWVVVKNINGKDHYQYYGNFDWYNYLFDGSSPNFEHNLSVSGGSEKIKYLVSANYYKKDGIQRFPNDHFDRFTTRIKLTAEATKWLTIGAMGNFYKSNFVTWGVQDGHNLGEASFYALPSYVPKNPDGTNVLYAPSSPGEIGCGVSALLLNGKTGTKENDLNYTASFNAIVKLYKGLTLNGNYSYKRSIFEKRYRTVNVPYSQYPGEIEMKTTDSFKNRLRETQSHNDYKAYDFYLDYTSDFSEDHNLKALVGYNYEDNYYKYNYTTVDNLLSDDLNDVSLGAGDNPTDVKANGNQSEWAIMGAFARVGYDYKGRYLAEVNARWDASSRFVRNYRTCFNPSFSAGWRVSEEPFFAPAAKYVSNLKIRGSYGSLGNQNVPNYPFLQRINVTSTDYYMDDAVLKAALLSAPIGGTDLTWETVHHKNIGLDLGLLNNRFHLTADYYRRDTKGMLIPGKKLPATYGAERPRQNAADLKTNGYELVMGWNDQFRLLNKPFNYRLSVSLSDSKSFITKYDNPTKLYTDYYVGKQLGEIWGLVTDGLFRTDEEAKNHPVDQSNVNRNIYNAPGEHRGLKAGDVKLVDLDGDNIITFGDKTVGNSGDFKIIGNSTPRYHYSFNLGFDWVGIDFSAFFQGVGKCDWYPGQDCNLFWGPFSRPYMSFIPRNFMDDVWSEDNPNAYFPRPRGYAAQGERSLSSTYKNDRYLQDLAYCRLKNVTIGYTFPDKWMSKIFVQKLRVYFTGDNLLTWTKLKSDYLDPEQCMASANSVFNDSGRIYQFTKTFSFGIDITF